MGLYERQQQQSSYLSPYSSSLDRSAAAAAVAAAPFQRSNSSPSLASDRQKFYNQLQLLANNNNNYNYYDNNQNDNENIIFRPPVFETNTNDANRRLAYEQNQYQLSDSNNNDYELANNQPVDSTQFFTPTSSEDVDRKKLLELLSLSQNDESLARLLPEDYRFSPEPNSKQHNFIYQSSDGGATAYNVADQTSSSIVADSSQQQLDNNNKNFAYQVEGQQQQTRGAKGETEKRSESKDGKSEPSSSTTNIVEEQAWPKKASTTLTTLLEDEEVVANPAAKDLVAAAATARGENIDDKIVSSADNSTSVDAGAEAPRDQVAPAATISYGKVVTKVDNLQAASDSKDRPNESVNQATGLSKLGSMFGGVYNFIANHWPAALTMNWSKNSEDKQVVSLNEVDKLSSSQKSSERQQKNINDQSETTKTAFTNPSVSEPAKKPDVVVVDNDKDVDSNIVMDDKEGMQGEESNSKWSTTIEDENKDKHPRASEPIGSSSSQLAEIETSSSGGDGGKDVSQSEQSIRIKPLKVDQQQQQRPSSSFESTTTKRETTNQSTSGHKISLLRQSTNMMLPFKASDELIVESSSTSTDPQPSLLGKYIYAPEHHYHLGTSGRFADAKRFVVSGSADDIDGDNDSDDDDDDDSHGQMFARLSQRSGPRNIHAGDDVYATASFNGLRPTFYASASHLSAAADERNDRLSMLPNKSNDIYFLVMVAAFCSMAMAVVLAAGLFAYRVQQNRKTTTEADYPTYGVVGPNNMNNMGPNGGGNGGGKCGAASFVGGYFAGMSGPRSSSSGSKSGSVKQLADMYSIGADSGISASAKSSTGGKRVILANDQGQLAAAMGGAAGVNNNNNNQNGQTRFANQNAARMFHYQHQKQQMIISDRSSNGRQTSASDLDSEDENDENSYTVYECPGLASAHEMEIKNPLFNDDQTP